ncbi:family 78 glycoside hydrolase catalytic domain [Arachidicoccus terrestris]|uniref:family 78 glycoside hydrolase catalytic domain n=1 Tax=Arachidicoccus terrestris TaxID=2875539 RepID=UPI001CC531DA|nr:family 78 glycoside hydrolase catalytic domain [Arachidicoccus terrestris]UAY56190.1 glycoside hydrolase family 78 protein [Arachidicoccus terrestris]
MVQTGRHTMTISGCSRQPGAPSAWAAMSWRLLSIFSCIAILICCQRSLSAQPVVSYKKTTEGKSSPVGELKVNQRLSRDKIFVGQYPQLSWLVKRTADAAGQGLQAYQVLVGTKTGIEKAKRLLLEQTAASAADGLLWNTGKQHKSNLLPVSYKGASLEPDQTYYWCVRVWNGTGNASAWSGTDSFHTALFSRGDWGRARWIGRTQMTGKERVLPGDTAVKVKGPDGKVRKLPFGTDNDTLPLLRKEFALTDKPGQIEKATLFISGLGQFEARLNGMKIGDYFLDPGWTNYQKEALYVGLDVTDKLQAGVNALGVELGNGFYYIPGSKRWYKKLLVQYGYPKMICRLTIRYKSGRVQHIVSDETWKTGVSSIQFSSIYGGELEDGRLREAGWDKVGFDALAHGWMPAKLVTDTPRALRLQRIDPIKVMEIFSPKELYPVSEGTKTPGWTFDMGQNCSGIPAVWLNGKRGDTVTLTPAELINDNNSANQKATGKYRLVYVLAKDGPQQWHPTFTYYGFRYIQVDGAVPAGKPNPDGLPVVQKLETWHLRNSAPPAGSFSCSNDLLNKTSELIRWAMKSNMMSVFTDCPHREKLGWLEQVHLMGSSVRYNWQIQHLLKKSLEDMRSAQTPEGLIPEIAPEFTVFTWGGDMFRDSPEWGSSAIIIPWYLYQWYGDSSELKKSYPMMTRYIDYLDRKAKENILYQGLGDWYDLGPERPGTSQLTPKGLTATAIYYYDLKILEKTARLLAKENDLGKFTSQAAAVRQAFNRKFLHSGTDSLGQKQAYYGSGSQTSDAMALFMGLVPDTLHDQVVDHLVTGIVKNNYALTAGDIGYRYLIRVLEQEGYNDLIFKMNNRSDVPGYGYQIARGATALTESWQALPSVSNNHFMLGHLMEWFYSGILGIRLDMAVTGQGDDAPQLIIAPQMVAGLNWAKGGYQTPYGQIQVDWQRQENGFQVKLHIPAGLHAEVRLPYMAGSTLKEAERTLTVKIVTTKRDKKVFMLNAGSGTHIYTVNMRR